MGLVQAELERRGITTASITMLPEISQRVGLPRAMSVPYPLGFPLGQPVSAELQRAVLRSLLALCQRRDVPVLEELGQAS